MLYVNAAVLIPAAVEFVAIDADGNGLFSTMVDDKGETCPFCRECAENPRTLKALADGCNDGCVSSFEVHAILSDTDIYT